MSNRRSVLENNPVRNYNEQKGENSSIRMAREEKDENPSTRIIEEKKSAPFAVPLPKEVMANLSLFTGAIDIVNYSISSRIMQASIKRIPLDLSNIELLPSEVVEYFSKPNSIRAIGLRVVFSE